MMVEKTSRQRSEILVSEICCMTNSEMLNLVPMKIKGYGEYRHK